MSEPTQRLAAALADRYRIERRLGEGGMATVYLAQDLKHDRHVGLKVLRAELAAVLGAERFVQEIKTTASLQHPHILPLFDSGSADGFLFYVMPYIEGETLRGKLNREAQLSVEEAVKLTTEVADALDYAHRHGVIHRDIKPENILLHDGRPMVADFGIALAVSAAAGGRMTETGLSLGTPHYMSPEQATAEKEITARSDVYSLASVLYEMLAGEPPHSGGTAQQIIMKIITDEARPVTQLRKSVPPNVAGAVGKALAKLPADRFDSARAFAEALTNPAYTSAAATAGMVPGAAAGQASWRRWAWPAAAVVLASIAAWGWLRPGPAPAVARYGLAFPPGQEPLDGNNAAFGLAPDGSWIVYDGPAESGSQLWIKRRDAYHATPVSGTGHAGASAPSVAPNGEWIVFTVDGQLRKVPRGGGSAITVADSVDMTTRGVAWLDDGTIVYRDNGNRLRRVPDIGGEAEVVWTPPEGEDVRPRFPAPLPGGRGVLFSYCKTTTCQPTAIWAMDLRSGRAHEVAPDAIQGWYAGTGHLVFVRGDGGVFAAPFDMGSLRTTGPPVPVLEGVQLALGLFPDLTISQSGALLMVAGPSGGAGGVLSEAVWVTRSGQVTPVDPDWRFPVGGNYGWALSPDGRRLAITIGTPTSDIWIKELDQGPSSRLTVAPSADIRPRWTPDGHLVSFLSSQGGTNGLYVRRADGTVPAELMVDLDEPVFEALWSRNGEWLVLRVGAAGARDIWVQRLGADSQPRRLLASDFDENAVTLSPDSRWLAYESDESGQDEIYVRPFPDISAGKWTVSLGGGTRPLWSHSGRELFYVTGDGQQMMAAQVRTSPAFAVTGRNRLFPVGSYLLSGNYTVFDVSPDDQRFLMVRPVGAEQGAQTALILVENWFEELKTKVGR